MAEFIEKTDTLNEGREKINAAIQDAEDAKNISVEADEKATQALANSESTQTQLDTIVIEGDSSVEAAQARVDEKGEVHPTLKARIDDGFEKTNQQLAQTKHDLQGRGINVKYPPVPLMAAKGDGINDDSVAVQGIIDYIHNNNITPKKLHFPNGLFKFDSPVNPYKNQYYDFLGNPYTSNEYSTKRGVIDTVYFEGESKDSSILYSGKGNAIIEPYSESTETLAPFNIEMTNLRFVGNDQRNTPIYIDNTRTRIIYIRFINCDFNNWEYGFRYDRFSGGQVNGFAIFERCNFGGNKFGIAVSADNTTLNETFIRNNDLAGLVVEGGTVVNINGGKIEYNGRESDDPAQIIIKTGASSIFFNGVYLEPASSQQENNYGTHIVRMELSDQSTATTVRNLVFRNTRLNAIRAEKLLKITGGTLLGLEIDSCQLLNLRLDEFKQLVEVVSGANLKHATWEGGSLYEIQDHKGNNVNHNDVVLSDFRVENINRLYNRNIITSPETNTKGGNIQIVAGSVNGEDIRFGRGSFTITQEDTGKYLIEFLDGHIGLDLGNPNFPPFTVTAAFNSSVMRIARYEAIDGNKIRVHIQNPELEYRDGAFSFIAMVVTK